MHASRGAGSSRGASRKDAHVDYDFGGTERFEVTARLGEGAMGVVYRALDRERNETIAIKTLRNLDGEGLLRFKNEFRSAQSLQHPNLVSLGELIERNGRWFFTMELVDGVDFYRHVSPHRERGDGEGPPCDHDRLRSALQQLAGGLAALHRAGFVHRDIKPSNIIVSRGGRVVLLDFGFVTAANERSSDRVVGTVAYMSPEQAASLPVGPESDWYSVGVVLFEALTGVQPFDGMPLEVLMAKQHRTAPRPSALIGGVPPDLDQLCADLLRTAATDRPTESEVLRRLGVDPGPTVSGSSSTNLPHSLFVGREAELGELDEAFRACRSGQAVVVFIQGESGIGKSSLVRAFTNRLSETAKDVLVLHSNCHERESVPYKAFDGVADNLSKHLVALPNVDAAMLIPDHISPVAEVFPVLRRCEVVARAARPAARTAVEPTELRSRVFSGLRELFGRLASRQPVVLVIEDFQWADADSLALLRELMRPPEAPPLLLVTTLRETSAPRPLAGSPAAAIVADRAYDLHLEGLRSEDAREMARQLARNLAPSMVGSIDAVVRESRGHPLYIDEIVRFGALNGGAEPGALELDTVLWSRILGLDGPVRDILELVTIAGGPLDKGVAATTVRQKFSDFSRRVGHLRLAKLVQTTGVRINDRIDVFHDRVRQAVLAHLTPNQRRDFHERLAIALEGADNAAPETLAIHWGGAGESEKALDYTRIAADQAEKALAFDRAARLWRRCLDLLPPRSSEAVAIRSRLGDALANAGRGPEAANAYLSAAAEGSDDDDVVQFYARAAGQLLRSGHVDSSIEVLRRAVAELDLPLPETPRAAFLSLVRQRVLIRLRGLGFKQRRESEIPERDLTRVDISWALAVGFGLIDVVRGAEFQARHLRLALATGELGRVARALAVEVAYRFTAGSRGGGSAGKALALAEDLARRMGEPPLLLGINTLMAGIGGVCEGRWRAADESCRRAEAILRDRCSGVGWELSSARIMGLWALWYLGRVGEVIGRLPDVLREAEDRGDLYAVTSYRTFFTPMALLAADRPEQATLEGGDAMRRWSQRGFHFQHYFHLFASTQVHLYRGDHQAAHQGVSEAWPLLESSLLLSVQQNKVEALHFRARAELAHARATNNSALIKTALKRARAIEKERTGWADGLALLVRAAGEDALGRLDRSRTALEEAITRLDAADMQLFAAAARRRLAMLSGAAGQVSEAEDALRALGCSNPAPMADMLVPGFG
jgi:serine/threonine protein kinase/tetratricopeptide (TPR) repeat protein